ncbi:MAG: alpha/beta fold hydrolase, partial [Chloroflexota bacterium]
VTIVSGRGDRYSPVALGARLASLLSEATQIEIEGRSHALFLEQRTALVDILNQMLNPPYEPGDWADEAEESEPPADEEADEEVDDQVTDVERTLDDEPPAEGSEPQVEDPPPVRL